MIVLLQVEGAAPAMAEFAAVPADVQNAATEH